MKQVKELHSFYISKRVIVEKKEETPEGTLTKKVEESVPTRIVIRQPTAREQENAYMVRAVAWSKAVKDGLLTKAMLAKLYLDQGGVMSKSDQESYEGMLKTLSKKQFEFHEISLREGEVDKGQIKALTEELTEIYKNIQFFEQEQSQAFDQTAEVFSRNKTIQWFLLNLTYIDKEGTLEPFFKGKTDEDKENYYYELMEEDEGFNLKVIEKAILTLTFWYSGRAASKEDFEFMESKLNESGSEEA